MRLEATLHPSEESPSLVAVESNDTYHHYAFFCQTDVIAGPPAAQALGRALLKDLHSQLSTYYRKEADFDESLKFHLQRIHKALSQRSATERIAAGLAAVVAQGDRLTLASTSGVGVYLLRGNSLRVLSEEVGKDKRDTFPVDGGAYLGLGETLSPALKHAKLHSGDLILISNVDLKTRFGKGDGLRRLTQAPEEELKVALAKALPGKDEQAIAVRCFAESHERQKSRLTWVALGLILFCGAGLGKFMMDNSKGKPTTKISANEEEKKGGVEFIKGIPNWINPERRFEVVEITKDLAVPYDLVPQRDGSLFLVDDKVDGIVKVDADGRTEELKGDLPVVFPVGLTLADGELYLVDFRQNHVVVMDLEGRKVRFIQPGDGNTKFREPRAVAVDSQKNVFVADRGNNRIVKFSPTGEMVDEWVLPKGLRQPNGLAVAPDGTIFFTSKVDGVLGVIAPGGSPKILPLSTEDRPSVLMDSPSDLVITEDKEIVVVDANNSQLHLVNMNGRILKTLTAAEIPDLDVFLPKGLTQDDDGNLYLCGSNRLRFDAGAARDTKGVVWKITL